MRSNSPALRKGLSFKKRWLGVTLLESVLAVSLIAGLGAYTIETLRIQLQIDSAVAATRQLAGLGHMIRSFAQNQPVRTWDGVRDEDGEVVADTDSLVHGLMWGRWPTDLRQLQTQIPEEIRCLVQMPFPAGGWDTFIADSCVGVPDVPEGDFSLFGAVVDVEYSVSRYNGMAHLRIRNIPETSAFAASYAASLLRQQRMLSDYFPAQNELVMVFLPVDNAVPLRYDAAAAETNALDLNYSGNLLVATMEAKTVKAHAAHIVNSHAILDFGFEDDDWAVQATELAADRAGISSQVNQGMAHLGGYSGYFYDSCGGNTDPDAYALHATLPSRALIRSGGARSGSATVGYAAAAALLRGEGWENSPERNAQVAPFWRQYRKCNIYDPATLGRIGTNWAEGSSLYSRFALADYFGESDSYRLNALDYSLQTTNQDTERNVGQYVDFANGFGVTPSPDNFQWALNTAFSGSYTTHLIVVSANLPATVGTWDPYYASETRTASSTSVTFQGDMRPGEQIGTRGSDANFYSSTNALQGPVYITPLPYHWDTTRFAWDGTPSLYPSSGNIPGQRNRRLSWVALPELARTSSNQTGTLMRGLPLGDTGLRVRDIYDVEPMTFSGLNPDALDLEGPGLLFKYTPPASDEVGDYPKGDGRAVTSQISWQKAMRWVLNEAAGSGKAHCFESALTAPHILKDTVPLPISWVGGQNWVNECIDTIRGDQHLWHNRIGGPAWQGLEPRFYVPVRVMSLPNPPGPFQPATGDASGFMQYDGGRVYSDGGWLHLNTDSLEELRTGDAFDVANFDALYPVQADPLATPPTVTLGHPFGLLKTLFSNFISEQLFIDLLAVDLALRTSILADADGVLDRAALNALSTTDLEQLIFDNGYSLFSNAVKLGDTARLSVGDYTVGRQNVKSLYLDYFYAIDSEQLAYAQFARALGQERIYRRYTQRHYNLFALNALFDSRLGGLSFDAIESNIDLGTTRDLEFYSFPWLMTNLYGHLIAPDLLTTSEHNAKRVYVESMVGGSTENWDRLCPRAGSIVERYWLSCRNITTGIDPDADVMQHFVAPDSTDAVVLAAQSMDDLHQSNELSGTHFDINSWLHPDRWALFGEHLYTNRLSHDPTRFTDFNTGDWESDPHPFGEGGPRGTCPEASQQHDIQLYDDAPAAVRMAGGFLAVGALDGNIPRWGRIAPPGTGTSATQWTPGTMPMARSLCTGGAIMAFPLTMERGIYRVQGAHVYNDGISIPSDMRLKKDIQWVGAPADQGLVVASRQSIQERYPELIERLRLSGEQNYYLDAHGLIAAMWQELQNMQDRHKRELDALEYEVDDLLCQMVQEYCR